ncbi:MAG TPA: GGDEF domain-containing protein, partial [Thermoanaerobaculia bacterium]
PLPRKTTEVRLQVDDHDPLERAHTHEPALIMLEGDLPGQVFRVKTGRQIIGRRPECDIRVRERAVSGIHAEVIRVRDVVTINDLASTNGTLVNGMRIRNPVSLVQGNLLKIGNCVFKYVDSLLEVEFTEALHARGITDQLTGAFNKAYLVARLGFVLDTASESRPVGVIAFDFDNFKQVNDQYGHAAGDHILRATSAMISENFVRQADLFARMGGEEFVIILPETTLEAAVDVAENLRRTFEESVFVYEGLDITLTSSFGVCCATNAVEQPEFLLLRADELLYRSKRDGRNRVSC